jgi:hypothetical protein
MIGCGDQVDHARFGRGTALMLLPGRRILVRFDRHRSMPRLVLAAEIRRVATNRELDANLVAALQRGAAAPGEPVRADRRPAAGGRLRAGRCAGGAPVAPPRAEGAGPEATDRARAYDARQAVEAIRLGVVPARHVGDYTVGRETALARVDALLAEARGLRIVWGDYGAGKTHLLDVIESRALQRGFVTARIALDPDEVPPDRPQRLFTALVSRFRLPREAGSGLFAFLQRLVESPDHAQPGGRRASRFLSPYLLACMNHHEEAMLLMEDYLSGLPVDRGGLLRSIRRAGWRGPEPLLLSDYRTYGRVYLHIFGVLATWARDAGFAGILLLLDEVEYVEGLGSREAHLAQQVLDHFAAATLPEEDLGFDPEGLYKGGHQVHRELPLLVAPDQPLAVVFAATPLPEIQETLQGRYGGPDLDVVLAPLAEAHLLDLVGRIFALYRTAYPDFSTTEASLGRVARRLRQILRGGEDSARALVRATVALCDALRLGLPIPE